MSNRGLAILGFLIFTVVIIYELEQLNDEVRRQGTAMSHSRGSVQTIQAAPGGGFGLNEAILFMIYAEMSRANNISTELAIKQHPDLKPELRYIDFTTSVSTMKSTKPYLKFRSLKEAFPEDYAELKARYQKEHPGDSFAFE